MLACSTACAALGCCRASTRSPTATPAGNGDGSNLGPTRGYLVVESPKEYGVFVLGTFVGLTGTKIELDCGIKFVRLGDPPAAGVTRQTT